MKLLVSIDVLQFLFYCKQSNQGKGEKGIPNLMGPRAVLSMEN